MDFRIFAYFSFALACADSAVNVALAQTATAGSHDASAKAESTSTLLAANTGPAMALQTVEVAAHYDNGVGSSEAASQGVVLGNLLQQRPLLRPGEVLETVPGLVVTQHSGDGKANQYFLRGYNLDHGTDFATSVDGVPVNMPTNAHGQGYADLNFLIPELVDRINYRKGPYFAETGDFSSAGSADIRYRNSLDHDYSELTVGGFGYKRALLAASMPVSANSLSGPHTGAPMNLLGALELQHSDGPWANPENLHKVNGLVRLSEGSRANGWSIDASAYRASWNSTDQVPLSLIESGDLGRYAALDPTDGGETGRFVVSGEWQQHDSAGYTKISAFLEHYRLRLWSNFTFYELRPATGDQFEQAESRNVFGLQAAHGWHHDLLGRDSVTEIGAQFRQDFIHVGLQNTQSRIPFELVSDHRVQEAELGTYLQNSTAWNDWFRSVAGVREDVIYLRTRTANIEANAGTASGHIFSPKLSLIFGPWNNTELFFNLGRGFHSNDARGVLNRVDPTTRLAADSVPPLVASKGAEIGVRSEWIPGLQSSLALWSLNSDSEIIYSADSAIGSTSPNGASKRYGLEWNNHWQVNRHWQFDADFAWTHARYAEQNDNGQLGDRIPNAVSKVASVGISAQKFGPWAAELNTRYIGAYPLSQDASLVGPSAVVTNFRLQREVSSSLSWSLDVLNLFNRQYYDIAYQQDYQTSSSSQLVPSGITVHPGEPRQIRLTAKFQF